MGTGLLAQYSGQLIVMAAGLWVSRYSLSQLGVTEFGLWSVGIAFLTYLSLADFGVLALVPREIGRLIGVHGLGSVELKQYVDRTAILTLLLVPIVSCGAVMVWQMVPQEWNNHRAALLTVLVGFVITFPLRLFAAVLSGLQDFAFLGWLNTGGWLSGSTVTVCLLSGEWGLSGLAMEWVCTQSIGVLGAGIRLWVRHRSIFPSLSGGFGPGVRRNLIDASWASANTVAVTLFNGTDVVVISWALGLEAATMYVLTVKLLVILGQLALAPLQMSLSALAEARERYTRDQLVSLCQCLLVAQFAITGLATCGALAVNSGFLRLWLGRDDIYGGDGLTLLAGAALVLRQLATAGLFSLFAGGYTRRVVLTNFLDGCVTLSASLLLVPVAGCSGVCLASLIGSVTISLPMTVTQLASTYGVSPGALLTPLLGCATRWAVGIGLALSCSVGLSTLEVYGWQLVILTAAAGFLTCAVYLFLVYPLLRSTPVGRLVQGSLSAFSRLWPFRQSTRIS